MTAPDVATAVLWACAGVALRLIGRAAWLRDWSALWGVVIAVASIVAVGWVALHFNT